MSLLAQRKPLQTDIKLYGDEENNKISLSLIANPPGNKVNNLDIWQIRNSVKLYDIEHTVL